MTSSIGTLALARTLAAVETVAPLALAETAWDNVGVLLQAPHTHTHTTTPPHQYTHHPRHMASRVFLVNDLTRETLDEALGDDKVAVIVAYHPPLFKSFKRLTMQDAKQAIALRCAAAGVSIISPHTALDACIGGVNDWLVQGVCGAGTRERSVDLVEWTRKMMQEGRLRAINVNKEAGERFAMHGAGSGRIIDLDNGGDDLDVIVKRVKAFLGLSHVRLAVPFTVSENPRVIRTIAVCAGSGGSILSAVKADLYLTGEMSHHEVLAAVDNGTCVILCEHSNTERGYLTDVLKPRLDQLLNFDGIDVVVSKVDRDPLLIV